jgi:hypothetical protein
LQFIDIIHNDGKCLSTQILIQKQQGVPITQRKSIETKLRSEEDSDNEVLAQRLEHFTKSALGKRASINKPEGSHFSKLRKRKKTTMDVTTSGEAKRGKEIISDSQKTLSKETTRSFSGLDALVVHLYNQGECSLEDTYRSPKTTCLDNIDKK